MNDHLKQFVNYTAYNAVKNNLDRPNVSYCVNENEVHYKPIDPYGGHSYIDLGLPSGTLWATQNPTEYPVWHGTYNEPGFVGWEGNWDYPTLEQVEELVNYTTYSWITDYLGTGVNGGLFTSSNGNTLFLPAMGTALHSSNETGFYYFKNVPRDMYDYEYYNPFRIDSSGAYPTGGYVNGPDGSSIRYVVKQQ